MKPLVIPESALTALAATDFDSAILSTDVSLQTAGPITIRSGQHAVFFLVESSGPREKLLVIRRWFGGLFDRVPPEERREVFDRCMRIALRSFRHSIALNPRWMPYHDGSRVSIFAYGVGTTDRLVAEVNALDTSCTYVFDIGDSPEVQNLQQLNPDYMVFRSAIEEYESLTPYLSVNTNKPVAAQIELDELDPRNITKGFTFDDWYPRLSAKQKEFVDYKLIGPLRLRGAAGTGKTLAMVLKALKIAYDAHLKGQSLRILFITHSWPVAEQIDSLIEQIDGGKGGASSITVFPLLEIAMTRDYPAIGRQPLGLDSEDGKRKALREIDEVLRTFVSSDWVAFRSGCSDDFGTKMESPDDSKLRQGFMWDLLVEFGCVLAAQGILGHSGDRDRYLRLKRFRWMMPLQNAVEKDVVFSLWRNFLGQLASKKLISTDQIISDVLNDLSTFYWEAARGERGYDMIFVDEMHLFNAQERLTFHYLLSSAEIPPLVVMALDPRQSPREVFTQVVEERDQQPADIYDRARLGNPTKIDLVQAYRYTPEIAHLVRTVMNSAPGLDLADDWDIPMAYSTTQSGPIPKYKVFDTMLNAFRFAVETATKLAREVRIRKGRIAILCMDDDRFDRYRPAAKAQYAQTVFVISSRDDVEKLRYSGRKVIFSTPEYVAGLQFDTVIILDANRDLIPQSKFNGHQIRRFLAELYLGVS